MKWNETVGSVDLGTRLGILSCLIRYSADLQYSTSISIVDVSKTQS